jgi:type II secretory pathway component GspD/PulD (secretin)
MKRRFPAGCCALLLSASLSAQNTPPAAPQAAATASGAQDAAPHLPRSADRRNAAKIYLNAGKLFMAEKFEEAMRLYQQAADLDPSNRDYRLAIEVARNHAVTALVQSAAKARLRNDPAAARVALTRALNLDPHNVLVTQHLYELGDDALRFAPGESRPQTAVAIGGAVSIAPAPGLHNFHLHTNLRQVIAQVFQAYGLQATIDDSVRAQPIRFDIDDASFEQATSALNLLGTTFFVPLDSHRVLVAHDSRELRQQYTRLELETLHLSGLSATELTDITNLAKNVFQAQSATADATAGSITIRATPRSLDAFNRTIRDLVDGHSQVMLDVRMIQIAHTSQRTTGVQAPQSMSAFNVYAEEQSILTSNAALVQQIISSGLASANDPLAILGILIASGQVSSTLFSSGLAVFGGGLTESALSPGSATLNLNVNSSDSRQLDRIQLRLGDGEAGTLRLGSRYPIQISSYSSGLSSSSIAGLTTSGTSSSLAALLSSLTSSSAVVPQVEYQDLGFTLKATPNVMRNGSVALNLDLKIDALSGSSLDGNPILNSRSYSGLVSVKDGDAVVVASELDKSESRAVSGTPGIDDIPGLSATDSRDKQKNYATLVVVVTPHVVRGVQAAGHTPMLRIDRGEQGN